MNGNTNSSYSPCSFSRWVVALGIILAVLVGGVGVYCGLTAAGSPHYIQLRAITRACAEMAPAILGGAVSAAVICDVIVKKHAK